VASQKQLAEARRVATRLHRGLAEDIHRLREDAAVTRAQLADVAGIDLSFLCRLEDGRERPSLDTYAKLSAALGADLSARFYPNTGPAIRDRHQARILEALLASLHPRWRAFPEVAVRRPSRGWIDVVLHDERGECLVATEIQSDLRRLEQLLRWFPEKVAALPSWEGWGRLGPTGEPTRLLIVRSTSATRAIGREFARQLASSYPAHPADAIAALSGTAQWPGPALVWAELEPARVRLISRRQSMA
jgi:transcriptional regulator with XRE-family HTH domain